MDEKVRDGDAAGPGGGVGPEALVRQATRRIDEDVARTREALQLLSGGGGGGGRRLRGLLVRVQVQGQAAEAGGDVAGGGRGREAELGVQGRVEASGVDSVGEGVGQVGG